MTRLQTNAGSNRIRFRWFEVATLVVYGAIVAFAIVHHEPWADEAQAWQLARNVSLHELIGFRLHYEIHPMLWYVLLHVLNVIGVSYAGMHWVCGAIGVFGIALFVLYSPFPSYLKCLIPFTYFLLFQYVVVARPYVLVPPILFLLALRWKKGSLAPAVLLGLLANVELHAAVISGGLAILYCIEQIRTGATREPRRRNHLVVFAVTVICCYAIAIWSAWPATDFVQRGYLPFSNPIEAAFQALVWGVCQPIWLAIAFWVFACLCFVERKSFRMLLPVGLFAIFSYFYLAIWHAGLLIPLLICLLWITWPESANRTALYERACRVALTIAAAVQILWSYNAISYDYLHAYSGDIAAAQFLKPYVRAGTPIAVTYIRQGYIHSSDAVGILPYFDRNIFINWQRPFWWASTRNESEDRFQSLLTSRPPLVIVETRQGTPTEPIDMADPKIQSLLRSGYQATHAFCGTAPYRLSLGMTCCHLILQHDAAEKAGYTPPR